MQHQEWQELVPFYVAQTLPPEVVRRFESHLANCDECRRDIDDWRTIASAVWREADDAARHLPPLSQQVYNRLNYRDRTPRSRYSSNPPLAKDTLSPANVRQLRQASRTVPITLVAGIVVAVLFGGLLMFFALRTTENDGEAILLDTTPNSTANPDFAASGSDADDITATATTIGIIPTQVTGVNLPATSSPGPPSFVSPTTIFSPSVVPTTLPNASATSPPPPTFEIESATSAQITALNPSSDGGPYITLTPQMLSADDGLPLCEAFNPTNNPIEVHSTASRNGQLVSTLQPGDEARVRQSNAENWYYIQMVDGTFGWIPPENAYLIGSCIATLPMVSPIPSETSSAISTPSLEFPTTDAVVVVNAAYADLYTAPDFSATVVDVAERGDQFAVVGYQGVGTNRWVLVAQQSGNQVWLWASVVTEYPANAAPPTNTP